MSTHTKESTSDGMLRSAIFSDCNRFCYSIVRAWAPGPRLTFIMLCPRIGQEDKDYPIVIRCMDIARKLGYGGIVMLHLFAFRATDPKHLKSVADPIGPLNNDFIRWASIEGGPIICAWGVHGDYRDRDKDVHLMLLECVLQTGTEACLMALGINSKGIPAHPLYSNHGAHLTPYRGRK